MKDLRSLIWLPTLESSASSIRIAKARESPLFQPATCLRSLPTVSCTSSFEIEGGAESFFPMAVTVMVALPPTAGVSLANAADTPKSARLKSSTAL